MGVTNLKTEKNCDFSLQKNLRLYIIFLVHHAGRNTNFEC
jgi:hypothetical protein